MLNPSSNPGLPCPNCGIQIPIDLQALLMGLPLVCNCCRTTLTVNRSESEASLEIIRTVVSRPDVYPQR